MNKRAKKISTLGSRATAFVSVSLVIFLLGTAALVGIVGQRLRANTLGNIGFTIRMERECPQTDFDAMKRRLLSTPGVETFSFISSEDILAQESEALGEDIAEMLGANPYSSEFEVRVRHDYSLADSVTVLSERFADAPGVQTVLCDVGLVDGLDKALSRIGIILAALGILLLIVSMALINSTVSLSIYGRRFIIHTMKLVGATGGFIRRPFVLAALEGGLVAGVVAAAALVAMRYYMPTVFPGAELYLPWGSVAVVAAVMAVAAALLCAVTANFAAGRYLRASYDEMFLK